MRLNTGRTSSARLFCVTASAALPVSLPRRASEKPMALSRRNGPAASGRPFALISASASTSPRIWARNQGSMRQALWISSSAAPSRIACATFSSRSGVGVPSAARILFLLSASSMPLAASKPSMVISSSPVSPVSSERSAFCKDSWKVRPIAMASPTDFIEVVSTGEAPGNFSKAKRGNLGDHVIDGRLEAGGRGAAGDVVGDFVERVADRQLGGDLGDRKAGRFRRQRGRARHARVHLDDHQPPVCRVDRELHVGAAGLHPDLAQHARSRRRA